MNNCKYFNKILHDISNHFDNNNETYNIFIDTYNLLVSHRIDDFLDSNMNNLMNDKINQSIIFTMDNIFSKNTELLRYYIFFHNNIYSNKIGKMYKNLQKLKIIETVPSIFDYELRING